MEETRKMATEKEDDEIAAALELRKYGMGFVKMEVIKCAINLGIAEAIENHGSPMTISELSSALKCHPSLLYRIMRFLAHNRIFKEKPTSNGTIVFEQTARSRCLIRHGENSVAAFILFQSSPEVVASFQSLSDHVLANGASAFKEVHGKDIWSYAASDASFNKHFNDSMGFTGRISVQAITEGCPEVFDGIETLVDVGGGDGTAVNMLVKAFPWIKGINFDLPHVVNIAEKCDGIELVGGDMFESIPKTDAIFIKMVLHDWEDDECIKILKNCREAIPMDKGKVIIVEAIIEVDGDESKKGVILTMDLAMMALTTGKERNLKEWDYILGQAGFSRFNIKPLRSILSLIEAFPN